MSHLSQRPAGEPSRTQTVTSNEEPPAPQLARLRLRGAPPASRRRVVWDDDVVDNEGQGRKSSKICCIYTKPRAFDESSSESSSSGSDSESDPSDHDKRPPLDPSFKDGKGKGKQKIRSGGERDAGAASESSSGSESEGGVGDGGARPAKSSRRPRKACHSHEHDHGSDHSHRAKHSHEHGHKHSGKRQPKVNAYEKGVQ